MITKRVKVKFLVALVIALFAVMQLQGKVLAATNGATMPYAPNYSGSNVQLVVARLFTGNSLYAPYSIVKIYSTSPNLNIDILGFNHCSKNAGGNDSNTFAATNYKITTTNASENDTGALATTIRTNSHSCTYDTSPYNITLGGGGNKSPQSSVPGRTAYYVYVLRADMTGGGVNGFSVRVNNPGSLIGFSNDSGDIFAMQNRTGSAGATSFNIPFAADCSATSTVAQLDWFDDDWGGIQKDRAAFYFTVHDNTANVDMLVSGNGQNNVTKYFPNGGNGVGQSVSIVNFNPTHKYEWRWAGVEDVNGIQFHLPYDSINFNTTCSAWSLSGTSTVSAANALPGASVTFTHKVTNAGPTTATPITTQVNTAYPSGAGLAPAVANISIAPAGNYSISKTITIPATATSGQKYCQYINFTKSTGPTGPNANSAQACVTVGSTPPTIPVGCFSPVIRSVALNRGPDSGWSNTYSDNTPYNSGAPSPPSNGPRGPTSYTTETYTYAYSSVNSVSPDEYGDSAPTTYTESTTNPANVNYGPYVANYPYDTHTPVVGYTVTYKKVTKTYTRTESAKSNTYTKSVGPPIVTGTYTTYSYGSWTLASSGTGNVTSSPRTAAGPTMPPCYDRHFDLVPVSNSATFSTDPENPTSLELVANVKAGSLSATDHPAVGLRDGMEVVNFPVNGVYYTQDLAGSNSPEIPFTFGDKTITSSNSPTLNYNSFNDSYTFTTPVSRPPLDYGDRMCFRVILPIAQGTMDRFGAIKTVTASADSAAPDACTKRVGDKPYFKAFGSDIFVGGTFATDGVCVTPASASLIGQYRSGVGGASSQLAAIALIKISEVASASLRTALPTEPNGLTFANSGIPTSPPSLMGGQYDATGTGYCAPDYYNVEQFSEVNSKKTKMTSALAVNLNSRKDNEQTIVTPNSPTARVKIKASSTINLRHTLFIDGDAEIVDDIITDGGPWADADSIPYLTVIVRGNLYIAPNVQNITGVFIAQPDPARPDTGRIYTCTAWKDSGSPTTDAGVVAACRNKLTVTGAFIAQRVVLERTTGTLSKATANGGTLENASSPNIGEVFQFSPEFYISKPVFRAKPVQYDSIKGLPPVL